MRQPSISARATRRSELRRRRRRAVLQLVAVIGLVAAAFAIFDAVSAGPNGIYLAGPKGTRILVPSSPGLSGIRQRMVTIAEGQLGYSTSPASTYCNKYSAYWVSGTADCENANLDEEWCADFVAWVWKMAGVHFTYAFQNGDLNSSSASFYEWGVRHGTWHPIGSGYAPAPGDVAVYGLNTQTLVATHVAMVLAVEAGSRGPVAVNGDGNLTGYSRVEVQAGEYFADASAHSAPLSGYVSPS